MWQIIVIIMLTVGLVICGLIYLYMHKLEVSKYHAAAYRMVKEETLELSLKNKLLVGYHGQKLMVYLKWRNGDRQGYVFSPEKGIRIGRIPECNEICIQENLISGEHCKIYISENRLAVQDFQSANGTWVRRGLFKHRVQGAEYIMTGDVLQIGSIKIKIILFWIDTSNI